ncbi:hypothetical protein BT67DRAFT_238266 [Trichocladium antarcticum]|uniref:Uncharacterized protein n=1 Tax=Trichocladium antarcticum TaxID=1450529 RepID=A0AAN6UP14_9PEZI|nr:hypothetical protein BT67DRAFT_238266 [Trichocladium antarcticum]
MTNLNYTPPDPHLDPAPSYAESLLAATTTAGGSPLQILGASWGGINVTADIQSMLLPSGSGGGGGGLPLDMRTLWTVLAPDPAPRTIKTLTVLYRVRGGGDSVPYDDDKRNTNATDAATTTTTMHLLTVSEGDHPAQFTLDHHTAQGGPGPSRRLVTQLRQPAWQGEDGPVAVAIVAVVYGRARIETAAVVAELADFFTGRRRGPIRMTNAFFRGDPWPYHRKSWSVYFCVAGSARVQLVTGWEDGALEEPWSRYG